MAKKKRPANNRYAQRRSGAGSPMEICRVITDLYLTVIFGIFPLVVGMGEYGYSSIIEAKAWTWLAATGLWLLALGGYLICCLARKVSIGVRFGWAQWTAVGFTAVGIVSAALSEYPRASFLLIHSSNNNSVIFMASYAAAFIGVSLFGQITRRHIRTLGVSSLLCGALSAVQLAGLNPLNMYPDGMNYFDKYKKYTGAFLGTIGNIDFLAAFLCFVIPVLAVYSIRASFRPETRPAVRAALKGDSGSRVSDRAAFKADSGTRFSARAALKADSGTRFSARAALKGSSGTHTVFRPGWDLLLLIPALLSLYVLLASDVDAGKVGLMGGLVIALPVVVRGDRAAKYTAVGCGAAVVCGLIALYFWPGRSGFLYEASQILHGHIEPSFGHDRVEIWMETWPYILQHPILGSGPSSGVWLLSGIQKMSRIGEVVVVNNTHNTYLGWLLETGILGLGCVLAIMGKAFAGWLKNRKDDVLAALGAGVASYLVQDFFNLGMAAAAPFLWISLGILAGKKE